MHRTLSLAALAIVAGCANSHLGVGGQLDPRGDALRPPIGGSPGQPIAPAASPGIEYRQICRNEKSPSGWVVTDYSSGPAVCAPLGKDGPGANVATILRYGSLPTDTRILVCADRPVPSGWIRESSGVEPAATGRCPRKPGAQGTGPTVMEIRRVR